MIELYYWPTPNGRKITIMLEESGLEYELKRVDIGRGDQFDIDFLKISPNNRMPAIVDDETGISVFEGGAILIYLAEKAGRFLPTDTAARFDTLQWLFWQAGGLGPMAGQLSHFVNYAQEPVPYAQARYAKEYDRLLAVMDLRLRNRDFLAGDYSIADMAAFPWVLPHQRYGQDLQRFENLRRWFDAIRSRPAVQRAVAVGEDWPRDEPGNDRAHATLFGQDSATVFEAARKLQLDP